MGIQFPEPGAPRHGPAHVRIGDGGVRLQPGAALNPAIPKVKACQAVFLHISNQGCADAPKGIAGLGEVFCPGEPVGLPRDSQRQSLPRIPPHSVGQRFSVVHNAFERILRQRSVYFEIILEYRGQFSGQTCVRLPTALTAEPRESSPEAGCAKEQAVKTAVPTKGERANLSFMRSLWTLE